MKILELSYTVESPIDGAEILKSIEAAGRTCYKSEDKITTDSARVFVGKIIESGHHSVLEHQSISVRFVVDRGVSHEIVRHRLASYSQESTRYCNYSKDKFSNEISLIPMMDDLTETQIQRRKDLWFHIENVYLAEISEGIKPQQARDNLPTCLKTELVMTCNIREWRHFFNLRTSPKAHPQMRKIATELLRNFRAEIPVLFDDIKVDGE